MHEDTGNVTMARRVRPNAACRNGLRSRRSGERTQTGGEERSDHQDRKKGSEFHHDEAWAVESNACLAHLCVGGRVGHRGEQTLRPVQNNSREVRGPARILSP